MAIYDNWTPIDADFEDALWSGNKQYRVVMDGSTYDEVNITDMTQYTNVEIEKTRFGADTVNKVADAINNLVIDMQEVATESLVYQDYRFTITYSSGSTLGERAFQGSTTCTMEGYMPVAVCLVSVGNSLAYNPLCFLSGTQLYCNAYRASTSAVSGSIVTARVLFLKTR